ncbi:MAG: universal stress protein [Gemmatimonadota bacterium]|nr:universal stress protein [Gemmatimonadota bacterium]
MQPTLVRSILVATDLSDASDPIVRTAARLAKHQGVDLHLLHAFDLNSPRDRSDAGKITFQSRIESCERALNEQIRRTVVEGVEVASREVIIYAPEKAIVEQAAAVSANLLVLGPHRRRALADAFLGSTADYVIRHAAAPCLVLRGELPIPLRQVVVPVDLAKTTAGTLDVALAWADALGRNEATPELRVLHVVPYPGPTQQELDRAEGEARRAMRAAIADAAGRIGEAGRVDVREEVLWESAPADAIMKFAGREKPELLVLGTHGRGALGRAFAGSVSSSIVRSARCSVLLVPPALHRQEVPGL